MEFYTLTLSFLVVSLLLLAYTSSSKWIGTLSISLSSVSLGLCLCYLVISQFSDGGFNAAALNHLHFVFDPATLLKFWKTAILVIIGLVLILGLSILANRHLLGSLSTPHSRLGLVASTTAVIAATISLYFNPMVVDGIKLYEAHLYAERTKLPENLDSVSELAPSLEASAPEEFKDFILVFAEGYESAFLDEGLYPGLTPNLNDLITAEGTRIRGIRDLVLTSWTQGGMSAATCGLPLVPEYSEGQESAIRSAKLIGETCTGDLLALDGYQLHFFGGSQFGDNDKYRLYQNQGYKEVVIQKEFDGIFAPSTPTTNWGYHDADVLEHVSERFIETSSTIKSQAPRGYVVLTLDSHQPGLPSPQCAAIPYENGDDPILNGVHCDDYLISNFITQILDNPATTNTTIILMSDHLHAKPPEKLSKISRDTRDYLFVVFNAHHESGLTTNFRRDATALDIAPTLLALLGYEVNEFNLGRNLLKADKTLVESLGRDSMFANIANMRALIREHWTSLRKKGKTITQPE